MAPPSRSRSAALALTFALAAVGCSSSDGTTTESDAAEGTTTTVATELVDAFSSLPVGEAVDFGPAPSVPDGALSPEVAAALDDIFGSGTVPSIFAEEQNDALGVLSESGDPRVAWILLDMLRFSNSPTNRELLADGANAVTGQSFSSTAAWGEITDRLIAWDIPAPPGYTETKQVIYRSVLPQWGELFESSAAMDWRFVSWGGVAIDDRPYDTCLLYTSDAADD